MSNLGETLVQNRMADALFGDKSAYTGLARSEIYRWFTDPAERLRYPEDDRDRQSRAQVANLRAAYGSMGPRSRAGELARALQQASPEFAALWARHEVAKRFEDHKTLIHPELGPIEVDCQVLFTEDMSRRCWCSPLPRAPRATRSCSCWPCSANSASPRRRRLNRSGPRAAVIDALAARVPGGVLSLGTEVTSVEPGGKAAARVTTTAGELDADLVVAADGIGSATRRVLFPDHPGLRYAGFT